jgi:hypothetical protein
LTRIAVFPSLRALPLKATTFISLHLFTNPFSHEQIKKPQDIFSR